MTVSSGPTNPYIREFETTIEGINNRDVILEETYFYPQGGGQPADKGYIGSHNVIDVSKNKSNVIHTLEDTPTFAAGDTITCEIDNTFRTYCMRAHTASHALYGAARQELNNLGYGGFDIDETKVRVDFETTSEIDDDTLTELERLVNSVVWESRDVMWREIPKDDALANDYIAFNAATQEGVFESSETIRVVEIEDWDLAACGGTHVQNTNEIGLITILDRSNPGEGLTRVEFAVGPPAINHQTEQRAASRAAARRLAAPLEEIDEAVKELQEQKADIEQERDRLQQKIVEFELATLETIERDGSKIAIGTVTMGNVNDISDQLRSKVGNGVNGALVVGNQDTTFVVAATDGSINANAMIQDITEKFGGGGGGQNTFAQGGGLTVPPDDVIPYIRSELTFE